MKATLIKILLACLISCLWNISISQQKPAPLSSATHKADTVTKRITELSLNKKFKIPYKKDGRMVSLLSPYFLDTIISPVDKQNAKYKKHLNLGALSADSAKRSVIKSLESKMRKSMFNRQFKDTTEFKNCRILHIPVFYLSPNVVNYRDGENIAKYYSLDKGFQKYALLKGNALKGFIHVGNGQSTLFPASINDSIGIAQILNAGQNPVGIKNFIAKNPEAVPGRVDFYAYLQSDHLVFSLYNEGLKATEHLHSNDEEKRTFTREYRLVLADSYFAPESGYSPLQHIIDSYDKR